MANRSIVLEVRKGRNKRGATDFCARYTDRLGRAREVQYAGEDLKWHVAYWKRKGWQVRVTQAPKGRARV